MKTFVISTVSIVLASILFCPMVMAFPTMPDDLQILQPDPSLPKELSAFFGKWEGDFQWRGRTEELCVIVEKINEEKASLYIYRRDLGWVRYEGKVSKDKGQYKVSYLGRTGWNELIMKGEYLDLHIHPSGIARLRRVS